MATNDGMKRERWNTQKCRKIHIYKHANCVNSCATVALAAKRNQKQKKRNKLIETDESRAHTHTLTHIHSDSIEMAIESKDINHSGQNNQTEYSFIASAIRAEFINAATALPRGVRIVRGVLIKRLLCTQSAEFEKKKKKQRCGQSIMQRYFGTKLKTTKRCARSIRNSIRSMENNARKTHIEYSSL